MASAPEEKLPKPDDLPPDVAATSSPVRSTSVGYRPNQIRVSRTAKARQKIRDFMRPDRLREFGSTLALVAPLTVLIWIWAERDQTIQVPDKRPFLIEVRSPNPSNAVALASGQMNTVVVEMTGPRVGVEGIKDAIAKDAAKGRLTVDISDALPPGGPYPIVLDRLLDQQKIFHDFGVTVQSTEPAILQVTVDRQVERDVAVTVPIELQDSIQSVMTDPKSVKVRGPEQAIKKLEAAGKLRADLDISNLSDARGQGPRLDRTNIPIRPIEGAPGVVFETPQVDKLTLQFSQEEQYTIPSMVVSVVKAGALEGHVVATVTPVTLTGVKVIGPSDALRQLRDEKLASPPYAMIKITRDDIGTRGGHRTPVIMDLPPGVRVIPTSVSEVTFDVLEATAENDSRPIP